jgi:RNA polymerase-binding transcription factor DksA
MDATEREQHTGAGEARAASQAATLDRIAAELEAVDSALRRLDDGTYGRCVDCGAVIDESMLAQHPLTARCSAHLPASERAVSVLAGDDALPFAGEDPES